MSTSTPTDHPQPMTMMIGLVRMSAENYGAFFGGPAVHLATHLARVEQSLTGVAPVRIDDEPLPGSPIEAAVVASTGAHVAAASGQAMLASLAAVDFWAEFWRQGMLAPRRR